LSRVGRNSEKHSDGHFRHAALRPCATRPGDLGLRKHPRIQDPIFLHVVRCHRAAGRDTFMTELSVVLITKNQAWNATRLIESVLEAISRLSSREVTLVDSASADETVELARSYAVSILRLRGGQPLPCDRSIRGLPTRERRVHPVSGWRDAPGSGRAPTGASRTRKEPARWRGDGTCD